VSAPTIKKFSLNERPTASDLNTIYSTLSGKFGSLDATDFFYPLVMNGDIDMVGNRLLRVRELFGILNMEEFGTDEEGFKNAVNDLGSTGGVVLIPRSTTLTFTDSAKVKSTGSQIYIIGSGHSSQIFMANDSDDNAIVFDGCSQFHLSNLYINGNSANNSSGAGVVVRNARDFQISNVWIGASSSTGVTDSGIVVENSTHFTIKRNWIRNPGKHGIVLDEQSRDFNVTQNLVDMAGSNTTSGQHGVLVQNDCQDGTIDSNTLSNLAYAGVFVSDATNLTVAYNQVHNFGNRVQRFTNHGGITVRGASEDRRTSGVNVMGNRSTGGQFGITIGAHVIATNITGNYVLGNSARALDFTGRGTSQVNFRGNMCMGISNNGRVDFGDSLSVATIAVGVSNLPIQAIHLTWDVFPPSTVTDAVLGARYKGVTIYCYSAAAIAGVQTAWYTIEV
jgi:hypothetical protein